MKLKDLILIRAAKYIDTPDGPVKVCTSGQLPKTNFTVGPKTSAKYSDRIPNFDRKEYYKEYISRLLPSNKNY